MKRNQGGNQYNYKRQEVSHSERCLQWKIYQGVEQCNCDEHKVLKIQIHYNTYTNTTQVQILWNKSELNLQLKMYHKYEGQEVYHSEQRGLAQFIEANIFLLTVILSSLSNTNQTNYCQQINTKNSSIFEACHFTLFSVCPASLNTFIGE